MPNIKKQKHIRWSFNALWCLRFQYYGPIWYTHSNTCFQFLNNITCIFTHFFTHTYFHTCFQFLSACTKHPLYVLRWQGPSMKTKICILHKKTSSFSQLKKKKKKPPLISIVDFSSSFVLVYFYIDIIVSLICISCWHIL